MRLGTWMTSYLEALRILGIWKKAVSLDSSLEEDSWFLVSPQRDQLGSMKCAAHLLKKLCLSLLMSKNPKLKKVIKSFVPEPISCISRFPMYILCIHILVDLVDPLNITLIKIIDKMKNKSLKIIYLYNVTLFTASSDEMQKISYKYMVIFNYLGFFLFFYAHILYFF